MQSGGHVKTGMSFSPYENTYGRYGAAKFSVLRQHGYNAADYNLCDTDTELYHLDETALERKMSAEKAAAQAAGIEISQTHGPWRWPPQDSTAQDRAERMEKMKKSVIITALLGCRHLVIHPIMPYGIEDLELHREKETRELNLAFFRELVAFAKQYGVIICLENMPMVNFSLATPEQILSFVQEIGDEHLQICFDTGHVAVFPGLSVGDEIRRLGDFIKVFHIHDNNGDRDAHLYPTKGIIDWTGFAAAVHETGFDGVLSLETAPSGEYDDARFEQESMELNKLFRSLAENRGGNIL